jgi:hypothetical protein
MVKIDFDESRKKLADKSCGRSVSVLYFAMFLLMLIILGDLIKKGNNSIAWLVYALIIVVGLIVFGTLIFGTGFTKGGYPLLMPVLTFFMSFLGIIALVLANPDVDTTGKALGYIAVLLPGLCGLIFVPVLKSLKEGYSLINSKRLSAVPASADDSTERVD